MAAAADCAALGVLMTSVVFKNHGKEPMTVKQLRDRRFGFTLVELLVVVAIIGMLVALLLPAVQQAREAARVTQCKNNLKQLAISVELHKSALNIYPPARLKHNPMDENPEMCGEKTGTWLVRILPYIEESTVYEQWDLKQPWYKHDLAVRAPNIGAFLCPSRRSEAATAGVAGDAEVVFVKLSCGCVAKRAVDTEEEAIVGQASDYAGNHGDLSPGNFGALTDLYYGGNGTGVIISSRPVCDGARLLGWRDKMADRKITDGISKTFLIGEKHVPAERLGAMPEDAPAFDGNMFASSVRLSGPGMPLARGANDADETQAMSFGSWHAGGICNFAMADCSVRSLPTTTSTVVLGEFSNRANDHVPPRPVARAQ